MQRVGLWAVTASTGPAQALSRLAFLAGAPAAALDRFAAHARWVDAGPGGVVMDFDDATTDVFFVVQGAVRVLLRTADGERTQIGVTPWNGQDSTVGGINREYWSGVACPS